MNDVVITFILPTSNGSTKRPYKVMYTNANSTYHKVRYWSLVQLLTRRSGCWTILYLHHTQWLSGGPVDVLELSFSQLNKLKCNNRFPIFSNTSLSIFLSKTRLCCCITYHHSNTAYKSGEECVSVVVDLEVGRSKLTRLKDEKN